MIFRARPLSLPPKQGCLSIVKSRHLWFVAVLALAVVQSCASAEVGGGVESQGSGGASGGGGGGGGILGSLPDALTLTVPDVIPPQPDLPPCPTAYKQDDAGNYFCCPTPLRILSIGQTAKYGANSGSTDNTDAFQAFMNGNTNGTATMKLSTSFSHMADLGLDNYDVLVLQALEDNVYASNTVWSYSAADASALQAWVQKGGAVISMSGYGGNSNEVQPLNQLLAPFGIAYNTDDIFTTCPDNFCYCTDSSIPFSGWQTNYADAPAITHDLKKVGVFHGRSITCTGSDCQIFAKDSSAGNVGIAKKVGSGRIFAWADEWVTYTSQWGLTDTQWDSSSHQECSGHTAKTSYNVPQFWYNAFRWAVPGNSCFTIIIPPSAPPGQQIVY